MRTLLLSGLLSIAFIASAQDNTIMLGEVEIVEDSIQKAKAYNTAPRQIDVLHMDLELVPEWTKHALEGKADVYLKPYFYDIDSVTLDAKGFKIHQVALVKGGTRYPVEYTYDGMQLHMALDKNYKREETIHLYIDYTALPDSLDVEGGRAIRDAKGFYFIDETEDHMAQFWTQGEPESNSAWFPTIDKPYEKITHRIGITVDTSWITLSNGLLEFRTDNGDGTRTDYWKMDKPHAPYLVMLGGGQFDTVGTTWNGKPVRYFVEPAWQKYAATFFEATPSMMTFFSGKLGVEYPWQKYDQIVVRDYVSGAMENTTATVHGDFIYQTPRALADGNNEDVIAHELFHQWFGDLVTCESWGHLPLNESFATYGEIMWKEWKHGPDEAAWHAYLDLQSYLAEFSYGKAVKMIRPDFENPLEMFDRHSYAKGGQILHMLRHVVGDEAFFTSLQNYLTTNAYQAAEISDLRKAFEETTGTDLQWFFNQWFFEAGHPQLKVSYSFDRDAGKAKMKVVQNQDISRFPVYRLPVTVAIYSPLGVKTYDVVVDKQTQEFAFDVQSQPYLVKFDAENYLLAEVEYDQSDSYWLHTLGNAKQARDRYRAAEHLLETKNKNLLSTVAGIAMDDKFWTIQLLGLESATKWDENGKKKLKSTVEGLLKSERPAIRAAAISVWYMIYEQKDAALYRKNLDFISYEVNGAALQGLSMSNPSEGVQMAQDSLFAADGNWRDYALDAIAHFGSIDQMKTTEGQVESKDGYTKLMWYYFLGEHLSRAGDEGKYIVDVLAEKAQDNSIGNLQYYAYQFLVDNTDLTEELAATAAENEAKKMNDLVKYARGKIKAIEEAE